MVLQAHLTGKVSVTLFMIEYVEMESVYQTTRTTDITAFVKKAIGLIKKLATVKVKTGSLCVLVHRTSMLNDNWWNFQMMQRFSKLLYKDSEINLFIVEQQFSHMLLQRRKSNSYIHPILSFAAPCRPQIKYTTQHLLRIKIVKLCK